MSTKPARPFVAYGELTFVAGDSYVVVYEGPAPHPYGESRDNPVPVAMVDYPRSIKRCHLDQAIFEHLVDGLLDEATRSDRP